jgi:hypothetical protein
MAEEENQAPQPEQPSQGQNQGQPPTDANTSARDEARSEEVLLDYFKKAKQSENQRK